MKSYTQKIFKLTLLVAAFALVVVVWGQENKNRRGSGGANPPAAAEQNNSSSSADAEPSPAPKTRKEAARDARQERLQRDRSN
jgi:hypothetical protein